MMGTVVRPSDLTNHQSAPWPEELVQIVEACSYRPGWKIMMCDVDRDTVQGTGEVLAKGLTLVITTQGYDSYHPERGENYRVHHFMPVPAATYDRRSWQRWLFDQFLLVERHEAAEFFKVGKRRPYAPHHGPGNDPYIIFEHGEAKDTRTMFTGEVLPEKS